MPSDFGDESGEKMVDWMIRVGQDMGGDAMMASADKLAKAFRNAREGISSDGSEVAEGEEQVRSWARLNLHEFEELPAYDSIREIIDERLAAEGIRHEFASMPEGENLIFLVDDAPDVANVFKELEEQAGECAKTAQERLRETLEKSKDLPLAEKAQAAREASRQIESEGERSRDITRTEMRAK